MESVWRALSMPVQLLLLFLLLLFIAVLCFRLYPKIEDFFIFHPTSVFDDVPEKWGLTCEDVFFDTEDNVRLHGWFFPLHGDKPVFLFCHGNAGNISHRLENIRLLLENGLQVFIFDYRGYGKSSGKPSERGIYLDGLAAYDYLVRRDTWLSEEVVVFGRSLGASVAIEVALRRPVKALIVESAFTSTKEMAGMMPLFKPIHFLLPAHYDNRKKIASIMIPKLIIHGEEDDIIPFAMGKKLFRAAKAPKYFLPLKGAAHNDTYSVDERLYFGNVAAFARNSKI